MNMTTLEIILLVLGIVVFVASFIMPETQGEMEAVDKQLTKEQIQEMLKEEMKHVHEQVNDVIDETVSYSVEKSERALERLTNDKIQAISEYSGTVLEDIHKNHEETMFLYDMLNDKHENLKEVASEVSMAVKQANEAVLEVQNSSQQAKASIDEAVDVAIQAVNEEVDEAIQTVNEEVESSMSAQTAFEPMQFGQMEHVESAQLEHVIGNDVAVDHVAVDAIEEMNMAMSETMEMEANQDVTTNVETEPRVVEEERSIQDLDMLREILKPSNESTKKTTAKKVTTKKTTSKRSSTKKNVADNIALHFDGVSENDNNNEKILELHKQGKSNMAIAKQLGLGVGEVNLVLALFKENGL